jgi:hypothetical protein
MYKSECECIQTFKVAIWFTYPKLELILFSPKPVKSQSRFVKLFSIFGLKARAQAQALGFGNLKPGPKPA